MNFKTFTIPPFAGLGLLSFFVGKCIKISKKSADAPAKRQKKIHLNSQKVHWHLALNWSSSRSPCPSWPPDCWQRRPGPCPPLSPRRGSSRRSRRRSRRGGSQVRSAGRCQDRGRDLVWRALSLFTSRFRPEPSRNHHLQRVRGRTGENRLAPSTKKFAFFSMSEYLGIWFK